MKILQITSCFDMKAGAPKLYGLGDDDKVYVYSYDFSGWLENSLAADKARIAEITPPVQDNRKARRAAGKKK